MTDSGPPYPRYGRGAAPGANGFGGFAFGISPFGDIAPFDPWVTIISQYANSPIIDSMILSFAAAMDQTENFDNFYDLIWNIQTAVGYGLDVWGRIVGVSRTIPIPNDAQYLGFQEASSWTGFNQGGFYSGASLSTNYLLSDTDFRRLILAKAASNISDGSIISANSILLALFPGRGACYVVDHQNMSLTYNFNFVLTPVELAIVTFSGVLPSSAGVAITISQA